jgi:hypothetical protein
MTEIEKLRALLTEAREALTCSDCSDDVTMHRCVRCDEFVDRNHEVRDRIDAVLAEPPTTWGEDAISHAALLEWELDEVRAEVDRLKSQALSPKCEHGVDYGGMGVGCCPRCDQKALILASTETPKVKA